MEDNQKYFTVFWKIKNFAFSLNCAEGIRSPTFLALSICKTKWNMTIVHAFDDEFWCFFERNREDFGPERLELDYYIDIISGNGIVIYSEKFSNKVYYKGSRDIVHGFLTRTQALTERNRFFRFEDTLTVRCVMWKGQGSITESIWCFPENVIKFNSGSFTLVYANFSRLRNMCEGLIWKHPTRNEESHLRLYIGDDGNLSFEIEHYNHEKQGIYRFQFFIRDNLNNRVKCNGRAYFNTPTVSVPVTFSKEFLIENGQIFLPNDSLTVDCAVSITSLGELGYIEEDKSIVYDYYL